MTARIPEFPEFAEISLAHADEVRGLLRAAGAPVSEFTFANLFLFRRAHGYRLSRRGGLLLVVGHSYDGVPYAFPPLGEGEVAAAAGELCTLLAGRGAEPVLFPVPRAWAQTHFGGARWRSESDRDQADYVYLREELATLPGPRFHKRRNRLLKFLREHPQGYVYEALEQRHLEECSALAEGWCEIRCSADRPSTYRETEAVREALERREALGLGGGVIRFDGRVRAFCLGEPLDAETYVVHFEKVEPGYEGLAQLINRDFCRHGLVGFAYVNREQDLGDPGLRQAKQSYHPVWLAEKCRVRPQASAGGPLGP